MDNMNPLLLIAIIAVGAFAFIGFYFIPSIAGRRTKHRWGIFWLNFFFGWTFLGWVIALVWAVSAPKGTSNSNDQEWVNTCEKCGFKKTFNQPLKIYKCPQCGFENVN